MGKTNYKDQFKTWQAILGGIIILLTLYFGYTLAKPKLMVSLLGGFLLGYTLTRSRFGFAGGIKRTYVRGEGSLSKALLISLAVTTVLYGIIHYAAFVDGHVPAHLASGGGEAIIPGTQNVHMTNIGTVVGGFIFGIGMIIAGGCASGTLADLGEGAGHALIAFPFFVLSTIPGHYLREVVDRNSIGEIGVRGYLPDYFGSLGALMVTLLGLLLLYYITVRYEAMRLKEKTYLSPKSDYLGFEKAIPAEDDQSTLWAIYHKLFIERWTFKTGALVLSVVSACLLIFNGKAWGVTSAFTKMAVWFLDLFGIQFSDPGFASIYDDLTEGILHQSGVILDIGIIIGAMVAFLLAGRFSFDFKFNKTNASLFALGGLCMGFGSRLAKGCNIGALYSSIPNFSVSGWVFLIAISLGAVASMKLFKGGRSCLVPPRHRHPEDFK